jgi:hypothetical protein
MKKTPAERMKKTPAERMKKTPATMRTKKRKRTSKLAATPALRGGPVNLGSRHP